MTSYDQEKAHDAHARLEEPADPHAQCELQLEEQDAEIAQLHRRIAELERELAAALGKACEHMTYAELFAAVGQLEVNTYVVRVETWRHVIPDIASEVESEWAVSGRAGEAWVHSKGRTAQQALAQFRGALPLPPVDTTDATGIGELVGDASVGPPRAAPVIGVQSKGISW